MKPQKYVSSITTSFRRFGGIELFFPLLNERGHLHPYNSDFDLEDASFWESKKPFKLYIRKEEQDGWVSLFMDVDIKGHVLMLCKQLLPVINMAIHK